MLRLLHLMLALQANQATIVGTVKDVDTGEPLKAAVVALPDIDRTAVTDSTGTYRLPGVSAGPQHLTVRLLGYGHRTLHALVPASGELVINVLLQPEPIPISALTVRTAVAVRGAERDPDVPYPDRSVSAAALRNHPLLAEPDVFQALSGGEVVVMPESPSGLHIRGGASDQTAFALDGMPILNPYHAAGLFSAWNPDAISLIQLSSPARSPFLADALSGLVQGVTRAPASRFGAQGSFTTTQARATIDGPLGAGGAGYLLSLRSSYPGFIAPRAETSYLLGESGDLLAKLEAPLLRGALRVIGYDSDNEIETAVQADVPNRSDRNAFKWHSRSVGARWTRSRAKTTIDIQAWSAASDEHAQWALDSTARATVNALRRDEGMLLVIEHHTRNTTTSTGIRGVRSKTSYDVDIDSASARSRSLRASTPVALAFVDHSRKLGERIEVDVAASLASAVGGAYPGLHAQLRWLPVHTVLLTGSIARLHQYTQSLRNAESIAGNVFPVDLYLGADHAAIPVARSDQAILAVELRPWAGVRVALQGYHRKSNGLVLVAARTPEPFAVTDVATGSATSTGIAADMAVSGSRYGVLGSYGWQRTRFAYAGDSYVPEFAAAHNIEVGLILFPSATSSIRIGAAAAIGRRASLAIGGFEWESCNLLDRGCEFAGSPGVAPEALGATRLPAYLRVDLGVRKHWHIAIGQRDASLALFGTATNVFGRRNLLNFAFDPATSQRTAIEMRPPSPLVVGIDWRF